MPTTTLLGPQRKRPTITGVARELRGPVAVITAGWQENENDPLPRGLMRKGLNLGLYRRCEQVFDKDRELALAHRERQQHLKRLQRVYRLRLDHAVSAYRAVVALNGDGEVVAREVDDALEAIRALDRHHLDRVREVREEFNATWRPGERDAVACQRDEMAELLAGVDAVVLAGGHVAVLLNRMRLFDLAPLLADKVIVAWSAGAMVAGHSIVLFHDSPPWGAGNAELLDRGLDLAPGVLPLPDSGRRLRIDDPSRVKLLALRFAPLVCVGLDERSLLAREGDGWRGRGALRLDKQGAVRLVGRSRWERLEP